MGPKEPLLTDKQVEEQFLQMLDDMNLFSEEKRQPLLEQSIDKKRQLLSMREKGYTTVSGNYHNFHPLIPIEKFSMRIMI